ncbi:MAG TPA: hypothetical protein VNK04_02170 [Gemmataceae bacterium]|jgi:hypothetical protein|nr:hypothetical protein [Gemmataceae bacterium]
MFRTFLAAVVLLVMTAAAPAQYSLKETGNAPPKEVPEAIRKLLSERSAQLLHKGTVLCEVWFRKEVPGKATPQQLKSGLSYREIPETTLLAVLRVVGPITDYRKQKIKPGVYTLRLGYQPQDGDHMGTAPHAEFLLAVPADKEKDAAPMDPKELQSLSLRASGTAHPAVFLLFPGDGAEAQPKLVDKGEGHQAVLQKIDVIVDGQKAPLGIALTLVGVSSAA